MGKNLWQEKAVYAAIDKLEKDIKRPGIELFDEAMKNTMPTLEVKPRRVGGATYQVPVEIRPKRRVALAHRWVVEAARSNKGQSIEDSLYTEFLNAVNNTGNAIKRKRILIEWPKLIELLHITGGKERKLCPNKIYQKYEILDL